MNIFVTGINQGCGKTVVSAGIAAVMQSLGCKTGVYKPVQIGAETKGQYIISPDLNIVRKLDRNILTHATYLFTSNTIPAAASEIENVRIDMNDIQSDYNILSKSTEILITEGTGGLLTPLKNDIYTLHIPLMLKLPVVFVVTPSNNSLNAYLNELSTAYKAGLDVIGVIINKYQPESKNLEIKTFAEFLEKFSKAEILGKINVLKNKNIKANELFTEILSGVNLQKVLKMEIPKLNSCYEQ